MTTKLNLKQSLLAGFLAGIAAAITNGIFFASRVSSTTAFSRSRGNR
jgi:hypothetical protein